MNTCCSIIMRVCSQHHATNFHVILNFYRALKSRTSRKLGVKEFQMTTTHYLDLPSLERWLSEWRDALLSEAGRYHCVVGAQLQWW